MKKSQMLKFLFWTIVGLALFLPACALGSTFFKLGDNSIKSYTILVETVGSIIEGEVESIPFSMNKKSVIVGFSKNDNRFENHYLSGSKDDIKRVFLKPVNVKNGCEEGKACICLCNGYEWDKDTKSANCKDFLMCNSFDNIDILSEKVVKTYDNGQPKYSWKGGFLIHRDISDSEDVNGLEKNNIVTRTFYVVRSSQDIVGVCTISPIATPCIP